MVTGNLRINFRFGRRLHLSVPTVITGGDYNFHSLGEPSTLRVNFLFEEERIITALEIQN